MNHDIYTYCIFVLKISKNGIAVASINIIKKPQKWKILLKEKNIFSLYLSVFLLTHKINSFEEKMKNALDIIDVLSQQVTICKVQFQFFFVSHKKNKNKTSITKYAVQFFSDM